MFDWVNSFLVSLDKEGAAVLGTGIGAVLIAVTAGVRGIRKGTPTKAAKQEAVAMISQISCGAPEVMEVVKEIRSENRLALSRQEDIERSLERLKTDVAVLSAIMSRL